MKVLLKKVKLYTPKFMGEQDVLIENGKVVKIGTKLSEKCDTYDMKGKICCPMLVDGHEHTTYDDYNSEDLISCGVGTSIGVLGNESEERFVEELIEKTEKLNRQGINAYCLAGSKNYVHDTTKYMQDFEKVIGVKTALFQPQRPKPNLSYEKLKKDAVCTYSAQQKTGKTMQLHMHLDWPYKRGGYLPRTEIETGKFDNMFWIDKIVNETRVPYSIFKLTHVQKYFKRCFEYANKGCFIDYTAFSDGYDERFNHLITGIKENLVDVNKISISSDLAILSSELGFEGKEKPSSLLHTVRELYKRGVELETLLTFVTSNPGSLIDEHIGKIEEGYECRLLILNENLEIEKVYNKVKVYIFSNEMTNQKT